MNNIGWENAILHFDLMVTLPAAVDHCVVVSFRIYDDFAIAGLTIAALKSLSSSAFNVMTLEFLFVARLKFICVSGSGTRCVSSSN